MQRFKLVRGICCTLAVWAVACGGLVASDLAFGGNMSFLLNVVAPGYKIVTATPNGAGGASVVYDAQTGMNYTVGLNWASALRVQPAVHDVSVTAFGTCRYLDNNNSKVFLVPFKQQSEWRSFISAGAIPNKFGLDFCRMPATFGTVNYAPALSDARNLNPANQPTAFAVAGAALKRLDTRSTDALRLSLVPESRPHAFNMKRVDCLGATTYPDGTVKNPCNTWNWVEQVDARFIYLPMVARTVDDVIVINSFLKLSRTNPALNEVGKWTTAMIKLTSPPAIQPPTLRNCQADNQLHNAIYWIDQGSQSSLADCGAGMISDANDPRRRTVTMQAEYKCFDGTRYQNSYPTTQTREKPGSVQLTGQCLPIVNGVCGAANASHVRSLTDTSAGLCATGTVASFTAGDDSWAWTCSGANTGTSQDCQAAVAVDAACGSANGVAVSVAPTANLCATGTASAVTGTGPFAWTCQSQGGTTASCASGSGSIVTYAWASGDWGAFGTCSNGSQSRARTVRCLASDGQTAADARCTGAKPVASETQACNSDTSPPVNPVTPACGVAAGVVATTAPTSGLCSQGTASSVTGTGPFSWTCAATGAQTAQCATVATNNPPANPAFKVGMNLAAISYYSVEYPFVDHFITTGAFFTHDNTGYTEIPGTALGSDGWPNVPNGTRIDIAVAAESGRRFVLTYTGTGDFSVPDGSIVSAAPGRIVFDMSPSTGATLVEWIVNSDPVRGIHIVREDQQAQFAAGKLLNPDFHDKLATHFSPLRMMEWGCTNGNQLVHWADRPKLSGPNFGGCVPIEIMVQTANESNADLWLNIPAHADDDYVRQAVTLIRDRLASGLKLHLEYSNEVWNFSFEQAGWAAAQATAQFGVGPYQSMLWDGYRSAQIMKIAKDIMGNRVIGVIATQMQNTDYLDNLTKDGVIRANVGDIKDLFGEYAVAPYFGDSLDDLGDNGPQSLRIRAWAAASNVDDAFAVIAADLANCKSVYVRQFNWATANGMKLVTYEGGYSGFWFAGPTPEIRNQEVALIQKIKNDPRMATITAQALADFREAGGSEYTWYNDFGTASIWGPWGATTALGVSSPTMDTLMSISGR